MRNLLPEVQFINKENPKSFFDIVKIEELLNRELDHDICMNHLVKFYIILVIEKGKGHHTIDFKDYNYEAGTILLIRKDQIHKFFRNPKVKGYLLVFTEEFIISHLNRMEASKTMQLFNEYFNQPKIHFNTKKEFADFIVLVKQLESEYYTKDDFSIGITRSVLHIIITKLFRIKAKNENVKFNNKYLSQFLIFQEEVEKQCLKSRKVQYYADHLAVTPKTLNNIVREVYNTSAKKYIDERVILRIKRLLITTQYSIKEIAYTSGFSDPTNFYKFFKKLTNSTPEAFRKAHL